MRTHVTHLSEVTIADAARESVHRFSDEEFSLQFFGAIIGLLQRSMMEISGVVAE